MKLSVKEIFNNTFWRNLFVIAGGLTLYFLAAHLSTIWSGFQTFFRLLTPFFMGFVIAFLLNGLMAYMEKKVFANVRPKKKRRLWSLVTTLVITLGVIILLFSFLLPQLGQSINQLQAKLPEYQASLQSFLGSYVPAIDLSQLDLQKVTSSFLTADGVSTILSYSGQAASTVINLFIGLVVAIYCLYNKEVYLRAIKKVAYALLPDVTVYEGIKILRYANRTFSSFFYSKLIDSLAVGVICFVGMVIFGMKYALLISVIVGITNVIPFFGPFIGAIPSIVILLAVDPLQALWFAIFILVLQQFDGNIMGPRIMANSIGLPAIWVMFAIVIGGGLFGFAGMILGIPVFAMIYDMFQEYIETREVKRDASVLEKSTA